MSLCHCMKFYLILFLVMLSLNVFSHEKTTYPLLLNKPVNIRPKALLSIVVDAHLNKSTFKLVFKKENNEEVSGLIPLNIFIEASRGNKIFKDRAVIDSRESNQNKTTYIGLLPLDELGSWDAKIKIYYGNDLIDELGLPFEIAPEGPSETDFVIYSLPFIFVGLLLVKVFYVTRLKSKSKRNGQV